MVAADVAAQVSLGLPESLVPEVTRGLTVDLLAGISAHLGLRIVALADGEAAT